MFILFLKAMFIGFIISFPIGPIGILCLRRTLTNGPLTGFASGVGAAVADAIYSFIALFGLSVISSHIYHYQTLFRFIGGLFLIALGTTILISKPVLKSKESHTDALHGFISAFFVTISNPITFFSLLGIFAVFGVKISSVEKMHSFLPIIVGIFTGAVLWWAFIALSVAILRPRIDISMIRLINTISAIGIMSFGALALFNSKVVLSVFSALTK